MQNFETQSKVYVQCLPSYLIYNVKDVEVDCGFCKTDVLHILKYYSLRDSQNNTRIKYILTYQF